jgi:hypothetical protein
MNTQHDNLDDRLRSSDPASGKKFSETAHAPDGTTAGNPLRDWWLTTSTGVRRSLGGGVAVAAAATVVVSSSLSGVGGPLIQLADGTNPASISAALQSTEGDLKMMSMPYLSYEYVAGDSLSTSGGRGQVYRLEMAGTPESVALSAAEYFGVDGTVERSQYFDATYPSYFVGSEDGTAPGISVSWSGTGSWWYSNPAAYPELECLEQRKVGKRSDAYIECLEYEPGVTGKNPTESETRALAVEFFRAMEIPFTESDIVVSVDEWSSYASVPLVVDGQPTAVESSISWSSNGEISWAQGNSVDVVRVGDYDTISDAAAVDRLADWRWFGSGPTDYSGGWSTLRSSAVEYDSVSPSEGDSVDSSETTDADPAPSESETPTEPAPTESAEPGEEPGVEPTEEPGVEPTEEPTVEPIPLPSEPELPVQTVTIDSAKPALLMVWDQSGTVWLVPGVALTGVDTWWQTVITLVEGVIELPEPMDVMPIDVMPADQ